MKLIIQMICGPREGDRYLKEVLEHASVYADEIFILTDKADDKTIEICKSFKKTRVASHTEEQSLFNSNESTLRNTLWEMVRERAVEGDWICSLDCDEIFDKRFEEFVRPYIETTDDEYTTFKLCDMWNDKAYRVDGYWSPLITRLFRYKNKEFGMIGTIHSGCIPYYVWNEFTKQGVFSHIRLKHLGYIKDEDKEKKFQFYMGKSTGINLEHAMTINNKDNRLIQYEDQMRPKNVLITSLIRDRAWVLPHFLAGLEKQFECYPPQCLSFYFIVNDSSDISKEILMAFGQKHKDKVKSIEIAEINFKNTNSQEHKWDQTRLMNMRLMRNECLKKLRETDNEYMLSIDSDVVLDYSDTLRHLVGLEKEFVTEVFYATWGNDKEKTRPLPQVWINGGYHVTEHFLRMIKRTGIYKVGGAGACSLIHRSLSENKYINYFRVYNLPDDMNGEDRDFCTRLSTFNYHIWADTYREPKHLEKDDINTLTYAIAENKPLVPKDESIKLEVLQQEPDLEFLMPKTYITEPNSRVPFEALKKYFTTKGQQDEIKKFLAYKKTVQMKYTVSLNMMVKNEEQYIEDAILSCLPLVDQLVIVDTGSTDRTVEIASKYTKVIPYNWNGNFSEPRNVCIRNSTCDWILRIDGDERVPFEELYNFWKLIQAENVDAYLTTIRNYLKDPYKEGLKTEWMLSETCRIFRNRPDEIYYSGHVHEEIDDALNELGKKKDVQICRIKNFLIHLGYLRSEEQKRIKWDYYAKLAEDQIAVNPKDPRPYFNLAVHQYHTRQWAAAERNYQRTLEVEPRFWQAHNDLGALYFYQGKFMQAREQFLLAKQKLSENTNPQYKEKLENNLRDIGEIENRFKMMMAHPGANLDNMSSKTPNSL